MSIEEQIKNLQVQEANLKKAAKDLEIEELKAFAEKLKGKYYKRTTQSVTNQNKWNFVEYVTFGKFVKGDNSDYLHIENSRHGISWHNPVLSVSPWDKKIGFMAGNHKFTLAKTSPYESYSQYLRKGNEYDKYKEGYVLKGFVEVTEGEFMNFLQEYCDLHNTIGDKFSKYLGRIQEYSQMELDFNEMTKFVEIEKLLKSGLTLPEVKQKYMAQIINLFNKDEITELCQYDTVGNKVLSLKIVGGDDGTDYEPYTTRYDLESVCINWAEILYPIRLKLKCKVFDLVKKLENLKPVYNTDNWDVSYSGSYDVSFNHARLNQSTLNKVNELIKSHL